VKVRRLTIPNASPRLAQQLPMITSLNNPDGTINENEASIRVARPQARRAKAVSADMAALGLFAGR